MDPQRLLIANLVDALLVVVIAGLLVNRRYQLCRSFLAYTALVLLGDRLIIGWPTTFDTAGFWYTKEAVYWALKVAVTTEIGLLTFARLPRARRILEILVLGLTTSTLVAQLAPAAPRPGDVIPWISIVTPRGQAGILVVLAAVVGLAAYYRVPLHPFHRGIVLGFGLYLVVYTSALTLLRELGIPGYRYFMALDPTAYAATVGVWAWTAWRRAPALSPGAQILQPWARSS